MIEPRPQATHPTRANAAGQARSRRSGKPARRRRTPPAPMPQARRVPAAAANPPAGDAPRPRQCRRPGALPPQRQTRPQATHPTRANAAGQARPRRSGKPARRRPATRHTIRLWRLRRRNGLGRDSSVHAAIATASSQALPPVSEASRQSLQSRRIESHSILRNTKYVLLGI